MSILRPALVALLLLPAIPSLVGCSSSKAGSEHPEGRKGKGRAEVELPQWLLLPWGTQLALSPGGEGPRMKLVNEAETEEAARSPGRVVRVVGSEEGWWLVETVDARVLERERVEGEAIEHLEYYSLRLYVPAGTGAPVEPEPAPEPAEDEVNIAKAAALDRQIAENAGVLGALMVDPPLQSGETRPANLEYDWRVSPGAKVYWPDGREAGEVRGLHAFTDPGREFQTAAGELRCYQIVMGPGATPGGGLCFEPEVLLKSQPVTTGVFGVGELDSGLANEDVWGGLTGAEVGEAYGVGGLGLVGTGEGGGGTGEGAAVGGIGTIGGGGAGSEAGYGSGAGYGTGRMGGGKAAAERSKFDLDSFAVDGPDESTARRIVRARLHGLADCLVELAKAKDGEATGSLSVRLTINDKGRVEDLKIEDADATLEGCVEPEIENWRFMSEAPGEVEFELNY